MEQQVSYIVMKPSISQFPISGREMHRNQLATERLTLWMPGQEIYHFNWFNSIWLGDTGNGCPKFMPNFILVDKAEYTKNGYCMTIMFAISI